jgi:aspartate/methionine/tyrosine aminotransferase
MNAFTQLTMRDSYLPQSKIREITALSESLGAVNLSQGFTDDDPPAEIVELFHDAAKSKCSHQYADPRGISLLRCNIAAKLESRNGIHADSEREIVVTCGATEGLMATFQSLFEPGDRILTFSPVYENYFHQARTAGLLLETIPLREPDFTVTAASLENAYSAQARAILICNPCNPTGKVFSRGELELIAEFARRHNLLIVSDEAYEHFIWRGSHVSVASLPGAWDRSITIFSLGKTYSVTGWRVGCVVAPEALLRPISVRHELTTISAPHPCQLALAHALKLPASFYSNQLRQYEVRKTMLMKAAASMGIRPWDPAGAYFLWCDYSQLTVEPDFLFSERLLRDSGVAGVPGHVFYPKSADNPKRIRLTFSKSLATIGEAAKRLTQREPCLAV